MASVCKFDQWSVIWWDGIMVCISFVEREWTTSAFHKKMPNHSIVRSLGPRSKALPFFHVFTGCDTVPPCVEKGKTTAWHALNVFLDATEVCCCLSSLCDKLPDNEIGVFEECVAIMYDRSTSTNKVNKAHLDLFARKQHPYNGNSSLKSRSYWAYQARHTWGNRFASR